MTDLIPVNLQVPAHLAGRVGQPSALAQSLSGGITGGDGFPRISIKSGRFRIVENGTETVLPSLELNVIVVGANPKLSKTWYSKQWQPDAEPSAPDCFSLDGIRPHADSTDPQNDLCASCPQNAWGSRITQQGAEVKACADQKRLAVVAADQPDGSIYLLQVTPAALKGLNAYQKELAMRGIAPEIVKTKVSFDTDASFPKLKFSFGGFIDEATQSAVDKLFGTPRVLEITGETSSPANLTKLENKPILVKPAVAPAPQPTTPAPQQVAQPATHGFGQPTPPKAEPTVATSALADDIAALLGEVNADDAH